MAAIGSGTNAVITTGCIVGYGTVVSASAGYAILSDALIHMGGNPLVSFGIATTVLAGAAVQVQVVWRLPCPTLHRNILPWV